MVLLSTSVFSLFFFLCFASVVFGMFAYRLPVCDMSTVEHANANKQGMTAPLQAGGVGESLKCAVPPLDTGNEPLSGAHGRTAP